MMKRHFPLNARPSNPNRRRFLRGLGVCVALPALESLRPLESFASEAAAQPARAENRPPVRMAFIEFANGALPQFWWPTGEPGRNFELNRTMRSLEPV
jgi:hypothetical protein